MCKIKIKTSNSTGAEDHIHKLKTIYQREGEKNLLCCKAIACYRCYRRRIKPPRKHEIDKRLSNQTTSNYSD